MRARITYIYVLLLIILLSGAVYVNAEGQKSAVSTSDARQDIRLIIDGTARTFESVPYIENGKVHLQMTEVLEMLGPLYSEMFKKTSYAESVNDNLFLDIEKISEILDVKIIWNPDNKTIVMGTKERDDWWYKYPTSSDVAYAGNVNSRVSQSITGADFAWGAYAQRLSYNESEAKFKNDKEAGRKTIGYFEATGRPRTYAAAYNMQPDEVIPSLFKNPPYAAQPAFNAWAWEDSKVLSANYITYVGIHSIVNNEPVVRPDYTIEALNHPMPRYPDGTDATGYITGDLPYPVNARVYDVISSKNLNGDITLEMAMPYTGSVTKGLAEFIVGSKWLPTYSGKKAGDSMFFRDLLMGKDTANPFWREYHKITSTNMVKFGLDGAWFDNMSSWDNFRDVSNMFGDWSEYEFNNFLRENFTDEKLESLGIKDLTMFNIREYIKNKAKELGEPKPEILASNIYKSVKWLDDMIWNAYKIFKKDVGSQLLKDLYNDVKEAAAEFGTEEGFAVLGNDVPVYNHGWTQDGWVDMCATEILPGWNQTFGSKGIQWPPVGKRAIMYRAQLEHQSGPFGIIWLYDDVYNKKVEKMGTNASKVLLAEAFANHMFIKRNDNTIGDDISHKWINEFAERVEDEMIPRYLNYDIGILFSSQNQLANSVPSDVIKGSNMDMQYHVQGHWGFAHALTDAHIPYRTIVDWKLDSKTLETLNTLILPNAEALDDEVLPILESFVEKGGKLILTGPAGLREGFNGFFAKRDEPLLNGLVGRDISFAPGNDMSYKPANYDKSIYTRSYGKGTVVWTAEPIGHTYLMNIGSRPETLSRILEMTGESTIFDGKSLPVTVGAFLWKSTDGMDLYVDLVNYNVDAANDKVESAEDIRFSVRLPDGVKKCKAVAVSPDGDNQPVEVVCKNGWASIDLQKLDIYTSVKLTSMSSAGLSGTFLFWVIPLALLFILLTLIVNNKRRKIKQAN